MGLVDSTTTGLRKYATFSGRASRSEFWLFAMVQILSCAILLIPATIIDTIIVSAGNRFSGEYHPLIWLVFIISGLPLLSSGSRRLNDMGWLSVLVFLPVFVFAAGFVGAMLINSLFGYDNYASWGFGIFMFGAFLVSLGGLLAALIMPSRPSPNPNEVPQ